ncbi:MAG: NitT/TauT family transport system substrate-binding protein [Hyphomicrobiales bacterium]|nr:NitT/TauT family transport system substrate-binding protein [Hyphomicrobiales bacterium]
MVVLSKHVARSLSAAICLLALSLPAMAQKLRVGIVNTGSDIGIYIADKKGYFKAEGLDVEMISFTTAAKMIAPLGAGQLEVGGGTVAAGLYNAAARNIGIKIVADKGSIKPGYNFSSLIVRKDLVDSGRYKSFKDLKGMKVAIAAYGTGNAATLNAALERGGLKWSDVETLELGFPQHVAGMTTKAIDASITNEPLSSLALRQGLAVKAPDDESIYPNHQVAVMLYSTNFAKTQPEAAAKFMRAYLKGVRDYNDGLSNGRIAGPNAAEVIKTLTEYTPVKDASVYTDTTPNACDPDGRVNLDSLKRDLAFFKEQKWVESPDVTAESMIDMSFAEQAVKELGPYKPKTAAN